MILTKNPTTRNGEAIVTSGKNREILFTSDCITWCVQDDNFLIDAGSRAAVSLSLLASGVPYTSGDTITIAGEIYTLTDTLPAGTSVANNLSSLGTTTTDLVNALISALDNNYGDGVTTAVITPPIGVNGNSTLTITWVENKSIVEFINETQILDVIIMEANGTDPQYSNSRIRAELWRGDVRISEQIGYSTIANGAEVCFDFTRAIEDSLEVRCPDVASGLNIGFVSRQMERFYIRYVLEVPTGTGYEAATDWEVSEKFLVIKGVEEWDDQRTRNLVDEEVDPIPSTAVPLNDYQELCVKDKQIWLAFPLALQAFLDDNQAVSVSYRVKVVKPLGTTISPVNFSGYGVGYLNVSAATSGLVDGDNFTIQLQGVVTTDTPEEIIFNISKVVNFIYSDCCYDCTDMEIYWREPHGVCSTITLGRVVDESIITEGETSCIANLCGGADRLSRGKEFIFNKKSRQQFKAFIFEKYTEYAARRMSNFLASDYYKIKTKDFEGNPINVPIIPTYGTVTHIKRLDGEWLRLDLTYTYSVDLQTINNHD